VGTVTWSVRLARLVAPKGEAREHRVEFDYLRTPKAPADPKKCKRPPALDLPAEHPKFLRKPTSARSTRRLISQQVSRGHDGLRVSLRMRYHNGFALDEGMGHLMKAAETAGLKRSAGEGPRQTWRGATGTLRWSPDPDEMQLGCRINGSVVLIDWRPEGP
jgi:hypothetical protein